MRSSPNSPCVNACSPRASISSPAPSAFWAIRRPWPSITEPQRRPQQGTSGGRWRRLQAVVRWARSPASRPARSLAHNGGQRSKLASPLCPDPGGETPAPGDLDGGGAGGAQDGDCVDCCGAALDHGECLPGRADRERRSCPAVPASDEVERSVRCRSAARRWLWRCASSAIYSLSKL